MAARRLRGWERAAMVAVAVAAALLGALPAPAAADGLPVLGVDAGPDGLPTRDGSARWVTIPAGARTVLARIAQDGGRVEAATSIPGNVTIPAVAYDGTPAGLSADGRTLVLIVPRTSFPRRRTQLLVVATRRPDARRRISLPGDFSVDALSPDGRVLYLIQYLSATNSDPYAVRAYDLASGRLRPGAIVDPSEPEERMAGRPLARATGVGGRWEYTLYDGADGTPFVHALDTVAGQARCIDLDLLAGAGRMGQGGLALASQGARLDVEIAGRGAAQIDLATLAVSAPAPDRAAAPAAPAAPEEDGGGGMARIAAVGGLALSGVIATGAILMSRRRRAGPT